MAHDRRANVACAAPRSSTSFAFISIITPLEKQTLLEALADRVDCLLDVLTFKLEERKHGPAGTSGGPDTVQ